MFNTKKNSIFLVKNFLALSFFFAGFVSLADSTSKIIINNEAQSTNQNVITAPALVPSQSDQMRNLRKKQEIDTEDSILKELEKQRISDERKRFNKMFNKQSSASPAPAPSPTSNPSPFWFGEKSFLSLGAGLTAYYNVKNINYTDPITVFTSFGAYSPGGQIIFDTSVFYSVHYLKTPNRVYDNIREKVDEPGLAMAVKWSFLKGKMKPYVGVTVALIARKWSFVEKDGTEIDADVEQKLKKDVGTKSWHFSANAGGGIGADIALGEQLGLSVDLRYLFNLDTETRKTESQILTDEEILDEQDVILASLNLKYFFK